MPVDLIDVKQLFKDFSKNKNILTDADMQTFIQILKKKRVPSPTAWAEKFFRKKLK